MCICRLLPFSISSFFGISHYSLHNIDILIIRDGTYHFEYIFHSLSPSICLSLFGVKRSPFASISVSVLFDRHAIYKNIKLYEVVNCWCLCSARRRWRRNDNLDIHHLIPIKNSCERIFFFFLFRRFVHYYGCQRLFAAIRIFIYAIKMEWPLVPMRMLNH